MARGQCKPRIKEITPKIEEATPSTLGQCVIGAPSLLSNVLWSVNPIGMRAPARRTLGKIRNNSRGLECAWWWSTCLACLRAWVLFPARQNKHTNSSAQRLPKSDVPGSKLPVVAQASDAR